MLWVRTPLRRGVLDTSCDKVCQWLATGRWFFTGTPVSSTNKTHRHDITEILLKVALSTINQPTFFDLRILITPLVSLSFSRNIIVDISVTYRHLQYTVSYYVCHTAFQKLYIAMQRELISKECVPFIYEWYNTVHVIKIYLFSLYLFVSFYS